MSSTNRKRYIVDFHEGLYHFIHSADLVIYNKSYNTSYVAFGNYLYKINTRLKDVEDINDPDKYHIGRSNYCIAVIDREHKRICISDRTAYTYYVSNAVPDDWEKTFVYGAVRSFWINGKNNDYTFCLNVCKWIVQKLLINYADELAVVYNNKQTINKDICIPTIGNEFKETIKLLLDKYNLASFWFYEKPITDSLYVDYYQGWNKKWFAINKLPTIKEIYKNKVFSKEEQTYIIQRKFYTNYCRGFGIPFKEVVKHWKDIDGISILHSNIRDIYRHLYPTWKEAVILNAKYKDDQDEQFIINANKQSIDNRKRAIFEHINKGEVKNIVNNWRENNVKLPFNIKYKKYVVTNNASKGRYVYGKWVDKIEQIVSLPFDYVQLKYDATKDIITTSKGAKVRLADAIYLWNLYKETIKTQKVYTDKKYQYIAVNLANENLKCGIYPIIGIYHNLKYINSDNTNYYCWNVVIGCHTIWIDDFVDFIEYYKLQKYFPN